MDTPCGRYMTRDNECLVHGTREKPFDEKEWGEGEDGLLIELFMDGATIVAIADKFGRSEKDIIVHLIKSNIISIETLRNG